MPKRENGEFEILLGNKQLLSVFFIVVILLGVFFTMGYILGRNSSRPDGRPSQAALRPAPAAANSSRQDEPSSFGYATPAPPQNAPAQTASVTEPPKPQAVPPPAAQAPVVQEPEPGGVYLQVAAVKRAEAEVVAEVLRKKGFRSIVAPHPTDPVFRVLVGPLANADAVAKTREDLLAEKFKSMVRKF